jgi:hypothetical protein
MQALTQVTGTAQAPRYPQANPDPPSTLRKAGKAKVKAKANSLMAKETDNG